MAVWLYTHRAYEVVVEKTLDCLPYMYKAAHVGMSFHDIRERTKIENKQKHIRFVLIKLFRHLVVIKIAAMYLLHLLMFKILFGRVICLFGASIAGCFYLYGSLQVLDACIGLGSIVSFLNYILI